MSEPFSVRYLPGWRLIKHSYLALQLLQMELVAAVEEFLKEEPGEQVVVGGGLEPLGVEAAVAGGLLQEEQAEEGEKWQLKAPVVLRWS